MTTLPSTLSPVPVPGARRVRLADRISDSAAGRAAVLAGGLSILIGTTQRMFPQDEDPTIDPRTRVLLVAFSVVLWALVPVYLALGRRARTGWGAATAASGTTLLTLGTVTSAINGIDLTFFPPVAMAANLAWLVGGAALTVSLLRARQVAVWVALPLVGVQVCSLLLSQMGGAILAGAYLLVLGSLLLRGRLDRSR